VNQPRELLRTIPGLTLVEMSHPDFCCGSAGIYNIVQPETAEEILARKMADIRTTCADVIAVSNTGCHMQYLHGVMRHQMPMRVLHVMELLDLAYQRAMPNH
jgi:glycolate oxidase iron-sulfur subunit